MVATTLATKEKTEGREPQVSYETGRLAGLAIRLELITEGMKRRLVDVLRSPESTDPCKEQKIRAVLAPMAERIAGANDILEHQCDRLKGMIDRLEI